MRPQSVNRKIREGIKFSNGDNGLNAFVAKTALKLCGCWGKACKCARDVKVTQHQFIFDDLPNAFDGCKILFISDLHFPGFDGFLQTLEDLIESLDFDYCFLGGDYSNGRGDEPDKVCHFLERLVHCIQLKTRAIYGILGNHDFYQMAVFLESFGVKMLLNDNCVMRLDNDEISLVGLDDDYIFRDTNWALAEEKLDKKSFKILLSHSPDNYREASEKGYKFMFSGHTHGGQICLPPGIPLVTHSTSRGKFIRGSWEYKGLQGYTSLGAGTSPIGARFFANPQICLLKLSKGSV